MVRSQGGGGRGVERGMEHQATGAAFLSEIISFPQPWTHSGPSLEGLGRGEAEGEPYSETAQNLCQQEETQEAAFWSCCGRPVGVLSTKRNMEREQR